VEEKADQGTVTPLVLPEIVTLPAEIDISNADSVGRQLCAATRLGAVHAWRVPGS
jgi:hypothetical protein